MKSIKEAGDLKDKKVLLRVDFNIPVSKDGKITEDFRIARAKKTINFLSEAGAQVVLVSHISDVESFGDLIPQLHILLGREIGFIKNKDSIKSYFENYVEVGLLENIRQYPGEETNDETFAKNLSNEFEIYINDAFAVSHRKHASVSAITKFLPSYAGFLLEEEVTELGKTIQASKEGKVVIIGGAKASTKVPVIKNFIDKAEKILVGGVVANDILKENGVDVGKSIFDEELEELLKGLDLKSPTLQVPTDFVIDQEKILDIGVETVKNFISIIKNAKMIIWNGPMGLFEKEEFSNGTKAITQAVVDSEALKIVGGGDTIAAITQYNLLDKFTFVSTGGGAMLAFLAGQEMPGLEALNEK